MSNDLSPQQLAAWRTFITAHATIIELIDHKLAAAKCIPLHWYDVLIELVEAPENRLRMSEIARRVVLSRSTLTRLVDRLETEGFIVRERSGTDRRGSFAVLTESGREAIRHAWPVYARGIQTHFAQHLSVEEAQRLTEVCQRLLNEAQ